MFNAGFMPHQFCSEEEIDDAASGPNPEITLVETDEVYRCAVVGPKWPKHSEHEAASRSAVPAADWAAALKPGGWPSRPTPCVGTDDRRARGEMRNAMRSEISSTKPSQPRRHALAARRRPASRRFRVPAFPGNGAPARAAPLIEWSPVPAARLLGAQARSRLAIRGVAENSIVAEAQDFSRINNFESVSRIVRDR